MSRDIQTKTATKSPGEAKNSSIQSILSAGTRPKEANAFSASVTFGWRALLKIKHVPEQLFDVTAFPIMFTLLFTYLLGGAIAGSTGEYLQYLLPGILAQTVVMITVYTGVAVNNDIRKGVFDRFRSLPIWQPSVLVGALLGDAARYTLASSIVITLGMILGFRPEGGIPGVIMAVLLLLVFSFSLSWIWTAIGFIARSQESLFFLSFVILFPLTFASNIFVDPQTMPGWLEAFVEVNPVTFLVKAMRGLMHGAPEVEGIGVTLAISAGLVAVFGPLTMYLFRSKK
ncbi:ABC transporter permease [Anaerophaga thermohalophila]|jgi:ABC-2 type transport system permease protein|uniref:ABC transporter permease n=1 Tax=Anaerophaga thermohalophila TaxID=177400 RepID=UPI0002E4CFE7|nr:ABC transporter permease [Anaerophaga thermohalophila]